MKTYTVTLTLANGRFYTTTVEAEETSNAKTEAIKKARRNGFRATTIAVSVKEFSRKGVE